MSTNPFSWIASWWRPTLLALATGLLATAASCTYEHGERAPLPVVPCDTSAQAVTYAGVISPIFDASCRECHGSSVANSKGGGNDFGSYAAINRFPTNSLLGSIRHDPGFSLMPLDRPKLSACDISRIEAWVANGKPNN